MSKIKTFKIDLTPSWNQTLIECLKVIKEERTVESVKIADETLEKMASLADFLKEVLDEKTKTLLRFIADNDVFESEKEIFQHAVYLQYKETLSHLNQGLEHEGKETVKDLLDSSGNLIQTDKIYLTRMSIGQIAKKKDQCLDCKFLNECRFRNENTNNNCKFFIKYN